MSQTHEPTHEDDSDSAIVDPPLISSELAEKAEDILRDFAEEAELSMALIVNRDASLIAGISSEEDVAVDVISGLVIGASKAVKALVHELGETGAVESLHHGSDRIIYLHDLLGRFILVGVSVAGLPVGIMRQQAVPVRAKLTELLQDVEGAAEPEPAEQVQRSLRITGMLQETGEENSEEEKKEKNARENAVTDYAEEEIEEPESVETTEEMDPSVQEEKTEDPEPVEMTEEMDPSVQEEEIEEDDIDKIDAEIKNEPPLDSAPEPSSDEDDTEPEQPSEEEAPKAPRSAMIVVDSPFEVIEEEESVETETDNVETEEPAVASSDWGGAEIEILEEAESTGGDNIPPEIAESAEPPLPTFDPVVESPTPEEVIDEQVEKQLEEEDPEDEPAPRKSGPKYSFELG